MRRREHTTPRRAPPQAWILDTNGPPDISCSAGCFQGRALNVLPDAARRSIAHALAGLNLDPVVRLRIIAALAPILLDPASEAKPNGVAPPPRPHSPPRKAAPPRKAQRPKSKPQPIPTVCDGKIFPSRGAMAKHLAPILGKSATTRALLDAV